MADFSDGAEDSVRDSLLAALKSVREAWTRPGAREPDLVGVDFTASNAYFLPDWRRFELAARMDEILGKSNARIAERLLGAAWSLRFHPFHLTSEERAKAGDFRAACAAARRAIEEKFAEAALEHAERFDRGEIELAMARLAARALDGKESVPGSAAFWTLQTAVIFRGWGEHAEAERLLDRLDTMGDKTGPQMKILASGVRRGIELERKYQVQAVERLEKAVAAGRLPPKKGEEGEEEAGREPSKAVPPGDIAALAYRAGETWRRLGEREKAIRWFRRVFEETEAEEEIQDFALKGLLDCGAGEGRFPERIEEQKKTRISRLLGELENSETYFMAEEKLAALRDRRHAIPRLLEMLGSTDSMGLRSSLIPLLEDQDPAAVKAWESWWKDNREQPRREWIAAGFQAAGYSTGPASAPGSLIVLTRALSDKRPCVKWNAEAELRKRTGTDPYGPLTRETAFVTRRGACLAWFYRRWLALHRDGLRWDEEAGRFLLREEGKLTMTRGKAKRVRSAFAPTPRRSRSVNPVAPVRIPRKFLG